MLQFPVMHHFIVAGRTADLIIPVAHGLWWDLGSYFRINIFCCPL